MIYFLIQLLTLSVCDVQIVRQLIQQIWTTETNACCLHHKCRNKEKPSISLHRFLIIRRG